MPGISIASVPAPFTRPWRRSPPTTTRTTCCACPVATISRRCTPWENAMSDALSAAVAYLGKGWCPIPIPARAKAPTMPGWQKFRPTQDAIPRHFGSQINVGVVLGTASGGLVDIDLDCPETVALADDFL